MARVTQSTTVWVCDGCGREETSQTRGGTAIPPAGWIEASAHRFASVTPEGVTLPKRDLFGEYCLVCSAAIFKALEKKETAE